MIAYKIKKTGSMLVTKDSSNTYTRYSIYGKEKTLFINNDWKDYNIYAFVLRVPSNRSLPITSPCLQ